MAAKMVSTGKGDTTVPKRAATEACNTSNIRGFEYLKLKKIEMDV